MGAHLMSIDDPTEQAFIAGEIVRLSDFPGYTRSLKCSAWDIYFYKLIKARQVFVHRMRFISVYVCKVFNVKILIFYTVLLVPEFFLAQVWCCLFVWGFNSNSKLENYTLIRKRHHYRLTITLSNRTGTLKFG